MKNGALAIIKNMNKYRRGYKYFEQLKKSAQRKEKIKEVFHVIIALVIFIIAMSWAGFTFPY